MIPDDRRIYHEPWLDERTRRRPVGAGHGIDVASQRADELDERCLAFLDARFVHMPAMRPSALDLACGQGGQALRMAAAGARVTAVDLLDQGATLQRAAAGLTLWQPPLFVRADFRSLPETLPGAPYDVMVCQRAIHYVRYDEAVTAMRTWLRYLKPGGRIFLSASGLTSELGRGYPHWGQPVAERWARLAPAMADRHDMRQPVCLYEAMDLVTLLHAAGFGIAEVFRSPFGNVKAVAFV